MSVKAGLLIACAVLLSLAGCKPAPSLPYYTTAGFTPVWASSGIDYLHSIPAFYLTDQHNNTVDSHSLLGKIYIANFFFTSCGSICPVMTKNLLKVQRAFPADTSIAFLCHTVTPWIDSLPRLMHYSIKYGMDSRWHLVTGSRATIYQLARQAYFAEEEPGYYKDSTEFLHTEHVLLIDAQRHIRGVYNGTLELEIDRLIGDIRILKRGE